VTEEQQAAEQADQTRLAALEEKLASLSGVDLEVMTHVSAIVGSLSAWRDEFEAQTTDAIETIKTELAAIAEQVKALRPAEPPA
jgi:hypothetical protein